MLLVRPVMVHEVAVIGSFEDGVNCVHDPAAPWLLEYFTTYFVITEPPVLAGAAHFTARLVLPLVASTDVGGPGNPGMAGVEFADG